MPRRQRIALLCLALLTVTGVAPLAHASDATDQLKTDVALVLTTLGTGRDGLRAATLEMFEWDAMAQRLLGKEWEARTTTEREQFVSLFGDLVRRQLATLGGVRNDSIEYLGESVDRDSATVQSRVPRGPGQEMQLDYVLKRRDGRWRVYDVIVNHASLLGHYRAQFHQILKTGSYQTLIAKLTSR